MRRNWKTLIATTLLVLVRAGAQTPVVFEGGVANAASWARAIMSPGSLVSIFGTDLAASIAQAATIPLPTSLGGVSVSFNNVPAPLLFVSPNQINAQMPWNVLSTGTMTGTVNVVVTSGGVSSAPRAVEIRPFSPGIFTWPGTGPGIGTAIAINANGSLAAPVGSIPGIATEPAPVGAIIIILVTGLGAVDPPAQTGSNSLDALRRTTTLPTLLIGGREPPAAKPSRVEFSGMSPQFVGVNQLNVVVPDVPPGDAVPLYIQVAGATTSDRVTIAVRAAQAP